MRKLFTFLVSGLLAAASLVAADNYIMGAGTAYKADRSGNIVLRSSESGGVHTPHVQIAGGSSRSGSIATGQQALSTTAAQVLAASATRQSVCVRNLDASITIYVGAAGVTTTTGMPVRAGEPFTIRGTAAVYAIAASGTPTLAFFAEND